MGHALRYCSLYLCKRERIIGELEMGLKTKELFGLDVSKTGIHDQLIKTAVLLGLLFPPGGS
jgi:hypothetical protein